LCAIVLGGLDELDGVVWRSCGCTDLGGAYKNGEEASFTPAQWKRK
jgi:hypothetical protein